MRAMILAAGLGTRLRPLTLAAPKPSLPLANLPQLWYHLHLLRSAGVLEVMINLHYLPEVIPALLGDGSAWGMRLHYSMEPEILGTGGGLKKVAPFLQETGEPFILINGDTLIDVSLAEVLAAHKRSGALATMVLREDPAMAQFGSLGVNDQGRIIDFVGRASAPGQVVRRGLFTGVHVLEPEVLELLPEGNSCVNLTVYPALVTQGQRAAACFQTGFWSDVGTPERYLDANMALLNGRLERYAVDALSRSAWFHDGQVSRGSSATIRGLEQVQVQGPVLIGHNVQLEPGVRLGQGVVLGAGARVKAGAALERVVVWAGATVEAGAHLHNSVVWHSSAGSSVLTVEG